MWQPIETAPKDGTPVIGLYDDVAVQCYWRLSKVHCAPDTWQAVTLEQHGCGCCASQDPDPTHWMPLPDPPQG